MARSTKPTTSSTPWPDKKGAPLFLNKTLAFLGLFFILFAPTETRMNTPESCVIYLLDSLMTL